MAKIYKRISARVRKIHFEAEDCVGLFRRARHLRLDKWLQEKFDADVITLTLNLGQREDFHEIEERAYSTGAVKHFQMDAREEFVTGYVHPSIKANGMYQGNIRSPPRSAGPS